MIVVFTVVLRKAIVKHRDYHYLQVVFRIEIRWFAHENQ